MAEWLYLIHPPREDFVETITPDEVAIMQVHAEHLARMLADGVLVLAGPTFGRDNIGVAVIEATDEEAARAIMMRDPAITSGLMTPELREMRVTYLRGRE
jgi:uncharacterized protein YciI